MISAATFNYYVELLDDANNVSGCRPYSVEALARTMSSLLRFHEQDMLDECVEPTNITN